MANNVYRQVNQLGRDDIWADFKIESIPEGELSWDDFRIVAPTEDRPPAYPRLRQLASRMAESATLPMTSRLSVSESRLAQTSERTDEELESRRLQRESVIEQVQQITGSDFDIDTRFEKSAKDWKLVWDMGRSRDFESRKSKFLEEYPEGDIRNIPLEGGGDRLIARRAPNEPYVTIGMGGDIAAGFFSEHSLLALPAGLIATGGIAGTLIIGGAVAVGEVAQRYIEKSRGYEQDRSGMDIATGALVEGGVAGLFDVATRRAGRLMGISPKQTDVVSVIEARERLAQRALEEFGVEFPELLKGQVSGPFLRGTMLQTGATTGRVQNELGRQAKQLYDFFQANIDAIPADAFGDASLLLIAKASRDRIESVSTLGAVRRADAVKIMSEAAEVWQRSARTLRNRKYAEASALAQDMRFENFIDVQNTVREIRLGVFGASPRAPRDTGLLDARGNPLFRDEIVDIRLPEGQHIELERVMDAILKLDSNLGPHTAQNGITYNAPEQIARLRSRLFSLKEQPNLDSDVNRHVNELWHSLSQVLDNPTSGNPQAISLYREARDLHSEYERIRRSYSVKRALSSSDDTPESLAARFTNPNHGVELRTVKQVLDEQPGAWDSFRELMVNDLVNGSTPTSALDRIRRIERQDRDMLRMFMSEGEQLQIERLLVSRQQLESAPFTQAMQRFASESDRAGHVFNNSTPDQLRELIAMSDGGINSEIAQSMRGYVFRDIFNYSRDTHITAGQVLNSNKVTARIRELDKTGKLDALFTPTDRAMLSDLEIFSIALSDSADIGGGMMAGAARQKAIDAAVDLASNRVGRVVGLAQQLMSNDAAAYLLTRPAMRTGYAPMPLTLESRLRRWTQYSQLAYRSAIEEYDEQSDEYIRQVFP